MMRFCLFTAIFGCAILTFASAADQAGEPTTEKAIPYYCPVVGLPEAKSCCCPGGYCPRKATKEVTVEYKGAKLELCGSCCIKPFKAAPEKFAVAANHQLVATKQAKQVKCPICAGKVDPATAITISGIRVDLCSDACRQKIAAMNVGAQSSLVFGAQGFARGFVMTLSKQGKIDGAPFGEK